MTDQPKIQPRGEMLKNLRKEHAMTVKRTQALLREQKHIQNEICKLLRDNPMTVPDVAEKIGMQSKKVLWYMASYKKYGLIIETGMCGDYPLYQKAEEDET